MNVSSWEYLSQLNKRTRSTKNTVVLLISFRACQGSNTQSIGVVKQPNIFMKSTPDTLCMNSSWTTPKDKRARNSSLLNTDFKHSWKKMFKKQTLQKEQKLQVSKHSFMYWLKGTEEVTTGLRYWSHRVECNKTVLLHSYSVTLVVLKTNLDVFRKGGHFKQNTVLK